MPKMSLILLPPGLSAASLLSGLLVIFSQIPLSLLLHQFLSVRTKRVKDRKILHLVKASVSSSRVFGRRQESPDRLEVFSIFSFFTNSSSFFLLTTSSFLAGSSFFLTKSSCLRMMERFLASATEGGKGDWESLSRGEARPVVCKNNCWKNSQYDTKIKKLLKVNPSHLYWS